LKHEKLVEEMQRRGYKHNSPLEIELSTGYDAQSEYVDSIEEQNEILRNKKCGCDV